MDKIYEILNFFEMKKVWTFVTEQFIVSIWCIFIIWPILRGRLNFFKWQYILCNSSFRACWNFLIKIVFRVTQSMLTLKIEILAYTVQSFIKILEGKYIRKIVCLASKYNLAQFQMRDVSIFILTLFEMEWSENYFNL